MTMQQYCLRWNNHQPNFISVFSSLLNNESLVDVTLAAEGRHLQAHKMTLFTINPCQHPIVILKDVKFLDLKIIVDFMYYGEVNVSQEQLPHILKTAEMLKIKGLAEIPVDHSMSKLQNISTDKIELLTQTDQNWNSSETSSAQISSPCPPSPGSKRKKMRKSSTGSDSTEQVIDEHQTNEITLTSSTNSNLLETVIKTDPGGGSSHPTESNGLLQKNRQSCNETDTRIDNTNETEEEIHHVTLEIPQTSNISQTVQTNVMDESPAGPSTTSQITLTGDTTLNTQCHQKNFMGTKRGRFLMRQPRIKRESDPSQISEHEMSLQYLSIPPIKVERQCSEPLPVTSPPPSNLLTVPGAVLMKQHSQPLLPSQTQPPLSPPLHMPLISNPSNVESIVDRNMSPITVMSDSMQTHDLSRIDNLGFTVTTLKNKNEELKRSASSPQTGTRSSHCPVVRPGPALGCNYCWNTVDNHGRILRRKTKYHCPECHTNLCIVPCFQEYHERHVTSGQADPAILTSSVMKVFPKTTSM